MREVELLDSGWNFLEDIDELVHERSNEILASLRLVVAKVKVIVEDGTFNVLSKVIDDGGAALRMLILIGDAA